MSIENIKQIACGVWFGHRMWVGGYQKERCWDCGKLNPDWVPPVPRKKNISDLGYFSKQRTVKRQICKAIGHHDWTDATDNGYCRRCGESGDLSWMGDGR